MREISSEDVMHVSGAGIYTEKHLLQFRDMAAGAIIGGIVGGPVGFAGGLVLGAITGYQAK
ncbi:hypothetical protein [Stenotrophomonas sp. PS02300]|uniref:hypothetical protein n=1 Tax=Stenotrophomonas sp. PS02300 TaxID=2991426 RepID=UPI00249AC2E6|nr:hypothetical protein [Stenotrophomonas sp. PS02300]